MYNYSVDQYNGYVSDMDWIDIHQLNIDIDFPQIQMDKHIELNFLINPHSKSHDFDNDYVNNEQEWFSNHIPNLL
jgi:hypothetical protein